jgi:hypothetical protein
LQHEIGGYIIITAFSDMDGCAEEILKQDIAGSVVVVRGLAHAILPDNFARQTEFGRCGRQHPQVIRLHRG